MPGFRQLHSGHQPGKTTPDDDDRTLRCHIVFASLRSAAVSMPGSTERGQPRERTELGVRRCKRNPQVISSCRDEPVCGIFVSEGESPGEQRDF
ncbi:hypothetical protein OP10G_1611 [Fimbriimonas ginsengisoli Gsoil 348]|uniref:Uncharacterized protein n=1 Tax=Fimbriimonas ginsengisoli Gsoil 348 TaxID=661478 RepID=A0A068NTP8_FIMGI|nr:hypothetical protein OP10G_1611 [Fimbriimonas ginsengisoli Gsoil 348]